MCSRLVATSTAKHGFEHVKVIWQNLANNMGVAFPRAPAGTPSKVRLRGLVFWSTAILESNGVLLETNLVAIAFSTIFRHSPTILSLRPVRTTMCRFVRGSYAEVEH